MDKSQAKHMVDKWKRAAPVLERVREENIRNTDTVKAMEVLSGCIDQAIRDCPPKPISGMVEMQRYFRKLYPDTKPSHNSKK